MRWTGSSWLGLLYPICIALLIGCQASNSGLITSLEDLTSATEPQGRSELNQNRIISINGLLPHAAAGSLYYYKRSRSPSKAFGVTATPSFLAEARIDGPPLQTLLDIRGAVLAARTSAANAMSARLMQTGARLRVAAEQGRSPADPVALLKLTAELEAAQQAYETARRDFDRDLASAVKSVNVPGVLVMRWETKDRSSGGFSLDDLFSASTEADLATSGFAILGGLRLTTLFVGPEIEHFDPGTDKRWDWGLHYLFSGLVPWFVAKTYDNVRLTTYVFQVQNVLYLQDAQIEQQAALALKASVAQFANLDETLKAVEEIELESIAERLASLSNLGVIGSVKRRVYPVTYKTGIVDANAMDPAAGTAYLQAVTAQMTGNTPTEREQGLAVDRAADSKKLAEGAGGTSTIGVEAGQPQESWHTIYVVDTDLTTLQELFD